MFFSCSTMNASVLRKLEFPFRHYITYRNEPFSLEKTFSIIQEGRGSDFDPEVVDAFFSVENELLAIKEKHKDHDESMLIQMARKAFNL